MPGGLPLPERNVEGLPRPEVGLIVKFDNDFGQWRDELGRDWNNAVRFALPDKDVFAIDADANPPAAVAGPAGFYAHVGTVLFNMVVNPVSEKVYVSNTEAINEVRFEGPGILGTTVNGQLHEARISVLDGGTVTPVHLNKHINYAVVPSPPGTGDDSLATPVDMAVSSDGGTLYVAAFGSSKVGVFDTAALEADTFTPDAADHIAVTGGGPSGVVLDEVNDRLYVFTRFDNSVSVVDTVGKIEVEHLSLYNPEPPEVVDGRPVLYDAVATSSNGEASCSSCHVFGDFDSLSWDLGNPDEVLLVNTNPFRVPNPAPGLFPSMKDFHPMKGPMSTQSLRGMADHGPMHWRGDRTGGGGDALDEGLAFVKFIVAFEGLLGRDGPISNADMQKFADFILQVTYPPNPIRNLDNSLTADQQAGRDFYFGPEPSDVFQTCNGCHVLEPASGHFGSDGFSSFEFETQDLKIPHLRNLYQKVGMFGMPAVSFFNPGDNGFKGDQVRGVGFLHDGSTDTVFRFHNTIVFNQNNPGGFPLPNPGGIPNGPVGDPLRRQIEAFMLAFDTNMAPIVGQQVTLSDTNGGVVGSRIDLLLDRASALECDVIVKGTIAGEQRGFVRNAAGLFAGDRINEPVRTDGKLRDLADVPGQELTYTCVPTGSGERAGVDRDEDGFLDRDEIDLGSDPADPLSVPGGPIDQLVAGKKLLIKNRIPADESKNKILVQVKSKSLAVPAPGSDGDPRCGGSPSGTVKAVLTVASSATPESHTTDLPCQNWALIGSEANARGYKYKDPELNDGTAKTVSWKRGVSLKATLSGKGPTQLDFDLAIGVGQGAIDVALSSGPTRVCMRCAPFNGKDGSDGKTFQGKSATCSPAPVACQ
jgi:hypothetical protein